MCCTHSDTCIIWCTSFKYNRNLKLFNLISKKKNSGGVRTLNPPTGYGLVGNLWKSELWDVNSRLYIGTLHVTTYLPNGRILFPFSWIEQSIWFRHSRRTVRRPKWQIVSIQHGGGTLSLINELTLTTWNLVNLDHSTVHTTTLSTLHSRLVDRRYSSLLLANQFRRRRGLSAFSGDSRVADRIPGAAQWRRWGWRCWRLWARLRVVGGRSIAPSALLKIIYVSSFPSRPVRPSVRLCVCLFVVRFEWKHNNNKRDDLYSPFPGADLATRLRFMMAPRTTIYVHGVTTIALDLRW